MVVPAIPLLNNVKVAIMRHVPVDEYWTGLGWQGGDYWFDKTDNVTLYTDTWTFAVPSPNAVYEDGKEYTSRVYGIDNAGNTEVVITSATFKYDTTKPDTVITQPSVYYFNLSDIKGTHSDTFSGVDEVQVRIKRVEDGKYWEITGSTWVAPSNWEDASVWTTSWTFSNTPSWDTEKEYVVNSRAKDNATNWEVVFPTFTFACDNTPPDSVLLMPYIDVQIYPSMNLSSGTCSDVAPGQVDYVQICIRNVEGGHPHYAEASDEIQSSDPLHSTASPFMITVQDRNDRRTSTLL